MDLSDPVDFATNGHSEYHDCIAMWFRLISSHKCTEWQVESSNTGHSDDTIRIYGKGEPSGAFASTFLGVPASMGHQGWWIKEDRLDSSLEKY